MHTNPSIPAQHPERLTNLEHSAIDSTHRVVNVCAVAIRNRDGLVLTVRKQGSDGFMMPGGKPEPGETPLQTACREVSEEIGLTPTPTGCTTSDCWKRRRSTRQALRYAPKPSNTPHQRATRTAGHAGAAG